MGVENRNQISIENFHLVDELNKIREYGKSLILMEGKDVLMFYNLSCAVENVEKIKNITGGELEEIKRINIEKKGGFDKRIFLSSSGDDDKPESGESITLGFLITDKFFESLESMSKNGTSGFNLKYRELDDSGFKEGLLRVFRYSIGDLKLAKERNQILSGFGELLFLVGEIRKFKNITYEEIEEVRTVKNRQK